ncbi:hypothetical protein GCM10022236_38590 [Microlunatus ginsengisoli]|uniref:Tryptophan-rich sensory protein n=2 Tax=Microlunatus ginsengisoli TaxID=363863 RepID=A0ABP7AHZ1_9ACTN
MTGAISDANHTAATPAGYAFSIWGLIYLASLAVGIAQLLGSAPATEANRRTGWWLVAAFGCSTVWVPIFGSGLIWLSQLVIFALVGCLAVALARLTALGPARSRGERWLLRVPVGLYLGWAICASAAGLGLTLRSFGLGEVGAVPIGVSLLLVALAVVCCLLVVLRLDALAGFAFTAGWALVAIAIGTSAPAVRITAIVGVVAVAAVLVVRTAQSTRKDVVLLG